MLVCDDEKKKKNENLSGLRRVYHP